MTLNLDSIKIPPEVLELLPFEIMRRYQLIPLDQKQTKIDLAMVNPNDQLALEQVRAITGFEPETFASTKEAVFDALRRHCAEFSGAPQCEDLILADDKPSLSGKGESQIIKAVEKLFLLALRSRASDIHLEPQKEGLFVRFRVDGVLKSVHEFPKQFQAAIVSRIKIMASLDISEKRLPQDGQITTRQEGRDVDLRVSILPCKYGEKIVIRILDKSSLKLELKNLGCESRMQGIFENLVEKPQGIILVTGPTGSGKTTTLYAVLNHLRSPYKNVITLEDPIEYEILADAANETGTTQVQVNPKIGFTFARGLRSVLRQDPDVIMVGEIRDKETAEIAMRAALTGHLVLSTLHTNDAPSTLGRLADMGVEPYLIASTVIGVVAQRLLRILCEPCKQGYKPPARVLKTLFPASQDLSNITFYRAKGCDRCQGTGYWGRRAIYQLLIMTEGLKQAIQGGARTDDIRSAVDPKEFGTLRQSGMNLVFQGLTAVEEVFRTTVD